MNATSHAAAPSASRRRWGFAITVVSLVGMMAGASAPSPFYPVLAAEIGFSSATITTVFAVYAITLLLTLLTAGSLSDHVGRRPVASAGLLLLAVSVLVFWHADSAAGLMWGRAVQGVASGLLLSSLSAAVTDLERPDRPGSAAVWNAVAPMVGLGGGALVSGIMLDVAAEPMRDIFGPLSAAYAVLAVLVWFVPETAPRTPGALRSLRFQLTVPAAMRAEFLRSAPAIFAGWATGGFFLSLGANIVAAELGGRDHLWQGLSVALLAGTGGLAALLIRRRSAHTIVVFGTAALASGTLLSLGALALNSLPLYLVTVSITGAGFGTAFFGVVRALSPHIPATQRADVFAVIFLVSYLAFGVPTVVAGVLVQLFGLHPVSYGYGLLVALLAGTACVLRLRRRRPNEDAPGLMA